MKDAVVTVFSRCSERGASSESEVLRADPIKGEKCRTKVSEGSKNRSQSRLL